MITRIVFKVNVNGKELCFKGGDDKIIPAIKKLLKVSHIPNAMKINSLVVKEDGKVISFKV